MDRRERDRLVGGLLRESFMLPGGVQDAFWNDFASRRARERAAWLAFARALAHGVGELSVYPRSRRWPRVPAIDLPWRWR